MVGGRRNNPNSTPPEVRQLRALETPKIAEQLAMGKMDYAKKELADATDPEEKMKKQELYDAARTEHAAKMGNLRREVEQFIGRCTRNKIQVKTREDVELVLYLKREFGFQGGVKPMGGNTSSLLSHARNIGIGRYC